MSTADDAAKRPLLAAPEQNVALSDQWRALRRSATFVAIISAPAAFLWLWQHTGLSLGWALVATAFGAFAFRGALDLVFRRFIPWPSLFATEDMRLREEDVLNRRRAWFWHSIFRLALFVSVLITIVFLVQLLFGGNADWIGTAKSLGTGFGHAVQSRQWWTQAILVLFLFLSNFLIFMGPLMLMGISQIRGFEPGDANWGVKLEHVRGQAEAKEEVRRIVNLWQSGEAFEKAGGRRERGLLFHGAPGTGKTMLAKAIATGFNSPFVSIPGSGFAQAQPLDAKILTPHGWTTMGAIEIGDEVIDPEGGTARVVGIFPQGERDIYRVTFSDGYSTECDLDHLWQVRRHPNRAWRVETLRSIKEKLETDSRQNRPYIPLVQNLEFEEQELPLDPYLLGVLLGDGCFRTTTPALIAAEPELVGASAARLPSGMWAEENTGRPGAYYLTAGKRGRLPNPLTMELRSLGLYGHGAPTKFVPDVYKYACAQTRLEVLRGLMDTDGHVRRDERSEAMFATSSSVLADDVVFLVQSLGGTAKKRPVGRGSYMHPVHGERPAAPGWQVRVTLGPDCNPFHLARKRDRWTRWEPSRRIVSIEKIGRKQAQCIKLDSENELYLTDHFIVTHNTFIGIDALIVRFMARKAKKLAAKWGGQCIVFIDEIDAVGMRRASLGGAGGPSMTGTTSQRYEDYCFYGPHGALNPTGDLILETKGWRDRLFAEREPPSGPSGWYARLGAIVNQGGFMGGMMGGGGLALNQLLVTMDGIDNPPFWRRFWTNRTNTILDAVYIVPRRLRKISLRLPAPRPTGNQIYFIGATNVPLEALDPALRRPGRMGRHVWFRTPTKKDREDIFELYLARVAHDPELNAPKARDELARITNGYAQPLDAELLTPSGWKRMGDVQPGDLLIGADGRPTQVVAVHPRGDMDVFKVTFNDGTSTECTADHLWTLEANDPRMRPRTLKLAEIVDRKLKWSQGGSRFYLPKLSPVEFGASGELPLDAYFLGLLLGDGGFTSTTPDFCSADEENVVAVGALAPAGVTLSQHGRLNWWLSSGPRGGVQRGRLNPLTGTLDQLRLWGVGGHDKFVPERYKWASARDRLSVLQGLMDTDGTRDYRRGTGAEFYSHSRQLAEDVAFLARSLGGSARARSKRDGWRVAVDLPDGTVPFRLQRKAAEYRASPRPFRKRILRIEAVGRKRVQCVTVSAEDGLYVTDGFTVTHNSPAMIEQVCSMALTHAHHDGRMQFTREDIVEAMTTVESGTAVGVEYVPEETRAVAIHEAGHAAAAHVFLKGAESTRISIRMRAGSLGHHMALEKEERFSSWKHEEMAKLVWTLGALAAEQVFYGENATGVGGDLQSATGRAAWMVGVSGMGPDALSLNGDAGSADEREERTRKVMKRFEAIGLQLMNRASGDFQHDSIAAVLRDFDKRALAAQIIGQAYLNAYNLVLQNKEAVEKIAETLIVRRELYGDELIELLNSVGLKEPKIDLAQEAAWPTL